MNRTEQLIAALKATGYRVTPQRAAVCRVLAESRDHPTPSTVYRQVNEQFPGISQATVYNTLTVLRDLGEIVEVGLGQERTHYEPNPAPHANLICLRCGVIEDLDDPMVERLSARLARGRGLEMKAARMDIYGFCHACQTLPESGPVPRLAEAEDG